MDKGYQGKYEKEQAKQRWGIDIIQGIVVIYYIVIIYEIYFARMMQI